MTTEFIKRQISEKPFYVHNVHEQLDLLHKEEISFSKLVENLNEIAYNFYKDKKVDKGVILPIGRSDTRNQLLSMEVGDSIYTEDIHFKARTVNHCVRLTKSHGMKFTTRKSENGWRTWKIEDNNLNK